MLPMDLLSLSICEGQNLPHNAADALGKSYEPSVDTILAGKTASFANPVALVPRRGSRGPPPVHRPYWYWVPLNVGKTL
jgi:hypothetical protein